MNKVELVEELAKRKNTTVKETKEMIDEAINIIKDTLVKGESVAIHGLGVFDVATKAARTCRNPATGGTVDVPAKRVVKFKVGKGLKDAVV